VETANTLAQAVSQHLVQFRRLAAAKTRTEVNRLITGLRPNRDMRALIKRFRSELGFPAPTARPRRS
jgi:hypothetical protein